MKNVDVKNKRELENALLDYIRENEDMSIKFKDMHYKFHLSMKGKKYVLTHAKEETLYTSYFEMVNFILVKCGIIKM